MHTVDGVGGNSHGEKGVFFSWVGRWFAWSVGRSAWASDVGVGGLGNDVGGGVCSAAFDNFRALTQPNSAVRGVGVSFGGMAEEAALGAGALFFGFLDAFPFLEGPDGVAHNCPKGNE